LASGCIKIVALKYRESVMRSTKYNIISLGRRNVNILFSKVTWL